MTRDFGLLRLLSSGNFSPNDPLSVTLRMTFVQSGAGEMKFVVYLQRAGGGREKGCHTQVVKYRPSVATRQGMLTLIVMRSMLNHLIQSSKNGLRSLPLKTQRAIPPLPPLLSLLRGPTSLPEKFPFFLPHFSLLHVQSPPRHLCSD